MKTILVDAVDCITIPGDNGYQIFDELVTLLDDYTNHKIVATNAPQEKFEEYALDKLPYPVFTLEHQPNKTDPEYFVQLLQQYTLLPQDVLYIEHNEEAVESAKRVDIVSYFYDDTTKDINGVKTFLDQNL